MAFNREYLPLGFSDRGYRQDLSKYSSFPVYTKYRADLSDELLRKLSDNDEAIEVDDEGMIRKIFLYDDSTNPDERGRQDMWDLYFSKIQLLSEYAV